MSYTKGPWFKGESRNKTENRLTPVVSSSGYVIALVYKVQNAELVAAAPELYEALFNLIQAANHLTLEELVNQDDLWEAAETALSRAERKEKQGETI